jgi:hypothetical protein
MVVAMNAAIAVVEWAVAFGFVFFGYQRWQMGQKASAMLCVVLASYFGRIALLYTGRSWSLWSFERVTDPNAILTNAALLLLALVMAVIEAHDIGFAEWRNRWKERHR